MTRMSPAIGAIGRRMLRRMTLILTAAALALAGALATAVPARAQSSDEVVRFLLGAAAVAIIIRGLDDSHRPAHAGHGRLPAGCLETILLQGRHVDVYNRGCLRRAGYHDLPGWCEVSYRTAHGRRHGFEATCLREAGYAPGGRHHAPRTVHHALPGDCEMTFLMSGRHRTGYDAHCLHRSGLHTLPHGCARTTRDGALLYDGRCLWDQGYRRGH